jgi:RND family efflux transporter MFP subunit
VVVNKIILPIGIIIISSAVTAAMILHKKEPEKKEQPDATLLVDTVELRKQDIRLSVSSQGNISPRTKTTLVSEISAVVLEVSPKFVAGGFFEKGEVLLKLNPIDYEVGLQQARANLLSMQAKFTQEKARSEQAAQEWELSGRKKSAAPLLALRTPYLEEAKANVLSAEANLKKAQRQLDLTLIRAPYKGMVKDKLVDVGQYVSTGTPLANTFAIDFAELRLPLTDRDISYLDLPRPSTAGANNEFIGPEVELTSTHGGTSYHWNARIVRTEGIIDQRTRVQFAVARIIDPYGLNGDPERPPLSIGSFVQAKIYGSTAKDLIAIPRHAVRGMNQALLMDEQERLRIAEVNVLFTDENYIYVKDGVSVDEYAIISAIEEPLNGMPLRRAEDH